MRDGGSKDETRIRIRTMSRAPRFEGNDDGLGWTLLGGLTEQLPKGQVRPALVVFREDMVDIVDLPPLLKGGGDVHARIAAFAGQDGVEAVGLVGVMIREKGRPKEAKFASVFIEWTDGRWWAAWQGLDPAGKLVEGRAPWVERAVDRVPRPKGLGAWFSRARFYGLKVKLEPVEAMN